MVSSRTAASEQLFGSFSDSSSKKLISTRDYKKTLLTSASAGGERGIEDGKRQIEVDGRVARRKKYSYRARGSCRETLHKQRPNIRPGTPASSDASQYSPVSGKYLGRAHTDEVSHTRRACGSPPPEQSMYLHRSLQKRVGDLDMSPSNMCYMRNLRSPRSHIPSRLQYSWDSA